MNQYFLKLLACMVIGLKESEIKGAKLVGYATGGLNKAPIERDENGVKLKQKEDKNDARKSL